MEKVIVIGAINRNADFEYYTFMDQADALNFFGRRIGEVFSDQLGEEGFLEGIRTTSDDDVSSIINHTVIKEVIAGKPDNAHMATFFNSRNGVLGSVILLSYE